MIYIFGDCLNSIEERRTPPDKMWILNVEKRKKEKSNYSYLFLTFEFFKKNNYLVICGFNNLLTRKQSTNVKNEGNNTS